MHMPEFKPEAPPSFEKQTEAAVAGQEEVIKEILEDDEGRKVVAQIVTKGSECLKDENGVCVEE